MRHLVGSFLVYESVKRFLMIIKFKSDSVIIFSWTLPVTLKRVLKIRVSWGNTFKCVLFSTGY